MELWLAGPLIISMFFFYFLFLNLQTVTGKDQKMQVREGIYRRGHVYAVPFLWINSTYEQCWWVEREIEGFPFLLEFQRVHSTSIYRWDSTWWLSNTIDWISYLWSSTAKTRYFLTLDYFVTNWLEDSRLDNVDTCSSLAAPCHTDRVFLAKPASGATRGLALPMIQSSRPMAHLGCNTN